MFFCKKSWIQNLRWHRCSKINYPKFNKFQTIAKFYKDYTLK